MDGLFVIVALLVLVAGATLWGHDSRDAQFTGPNWPQGSVWW